MSKKPNTAAALAGILNAKRGEESASEQAPAAELQNTQVPSAATPSPALPDVPLSKGASPITSPRKARVGKSKDKENYSQFSVYLRKDTRKRAGRVLEDTNPDQDFSELVQVLLEQWLKEQH